MKLGTVQACIKQTIHFLAKRVGPDKKVVSGRSRLSRCQPKDGVAARIAVQRRRMFAACPSRPEPFEHPIVLTSPVKAFM